MVDFFKKEKPFQGFNGFGGGAASLATVGPAEAAWNGVGASGGTTYDYTSPLGNFRVHKFTSTSATPFSAPGDFDRKVKYIVVGAGGGGGAPAGPTGAGGAGGGGAGAVHDATNGPGNTGSGIDLTGPFNFSVTCGAGGAGAPYTGGNGVVGGDSTVAFPTGTITAGGGGYGGKGNPTEDGGPGGSGGGAALYVPRVGGTGSGADFTGVPGDSPPVGWGQDGGPGGYGGQSPWSPTNPLAPLYVSGGGGGAGGKGISGGTGRAAYPGPTTANWRTAGVGGAGYLLPEIFRSPTNKMFKGVDGPEHWVAGGGGAGIYHDDDAPYEPTNPIPAANAYAGGGGAWSPIPGQPSHPPGSFAGAGYGGLGATPPQGGYQSVAAPAEGNSGAGGGAAGGGGGPTSPNAYGGGGGSGVVFLAYFIGASSPTTGAVTGSGGNIEATPGNGYKYHIFSSSGAFTVSGGPGTVEALLVAGGGGGSGNTTGGGGGAGGVRSITGIRVSPGPYTITVGEGGAGGQPSFGTSGTDTTAFDLRATGGGGGTGDYGPGTEPSAPPSTSAGTPGGSGGGAKGYWPTVPTYGAGGQGNIRGVYPVEGYPGGDGAIGNGGAGGGGAGGAGGNVNSVGSSPGDPVSTGGVGGNGAPYPAYAGSLFPTMPAGWKTATGPTGLYGGGGGGGAQNSPGTNQAVGGTGGGGDGDTGPGDGSAGVTNTGGGGGGGGTGIGFGSPTRGFAGGDGIVIIRYSV